MKTVESTSDGRVVNNTLRHQYRVLSEEEKARVQAIKDAGESFLALLNHAAPVGRECSIARTKIEEAMMWAVKGVTA